jgi:hypothetical protein
LSQNYFPATVMGTVPTFFSNYTCFLKRHFLTYFRFYKVQVCLAASLLTFPCISNSLLMFFLLFFRVVPCFFFLFPL